MSYPGAQGAVNYINSFAILEALKRQRTSVNSNELEVILKQYIDDKVNKIEPFDLAKIRQEIKMEIFTELPKFLKDNNFLNKDEIIAFVKELNDAMKLELEKKISSVSDNVRTHEVQLGMLNTQIELMRDSLEPIKAQIKILNSEIEAIRELYDTIPSGLDETIKMLRERYRTVSESLQELLKMKFETPVEFYSRQIEINDKFKNLKTDITLISSIIADINELRIILNDVNNVSQTPNKLGNILITIEQSMIEGELKNLKEIRQKLDNIKKIFISDISRLKIGFIQAIEESLGELPDTEENQTVKRIINELTVLENISLTQLKKIYTNLIDIIEDNVAFEKAKGDATIDYLKKQLTEKTNGIIRYLESIRAELTEDIAYSSSGSNKYLKQRTAFIRPSRSDEFILTETPTH
jgi:hypothetical protein